MTKLQKQKSARLMRANLIRYKVIAEYGLSENDKKRADSLIKSAPKECRQQAEEILNMISKNSEQRYIKLLRAYEETRSEIEKAIDEVDDCELQSLLTMKYLDGQTWNNIALASCQSERNVKYKHIRALDLINVSV